MGEHLYKGTGDCFKKIAAEEGLAKGLYKGFLANVVRSVGGALVLVSTIARRTPWDSEARLWSLLSTGMCAGTRPWRLCDFVMRFFPGPWPCASSVMRVRGRVPMSKC